MMMMARGALVVDENLRQLIEPFKDKNLHVITPLPGMKDKEIAELILVNRIFVTKNSKDFIQYAPGLSIGLIGLEGLKFIDSAQDEKNQTVKIISDALIEFKIWSRKGGFYLQLKDNGKHKFQKFY